MNKMKPLLQSVVLLGIVCVLVLFYMRTIDGNDGKETWKLSTTNERFVAISMKKFPVSDDETSIMRDYLDNTEIKFMSNKDVLMKRKDIKSCSLPRFPRWIRRDFEQAKKNNPPLYKYCDWDKKSETTQDFKQKWFLYNEEQDLWRQSISFKKVMSFYINKGWKIVVSGGGLENLDNHWSWAHLAKY